FMPCSVGSNSCAPTTGVDKAKVAPVNVEATKADSRRRWRPVLLRPPAGEEKATLGEAFIVRQILSPRLAWLGSMPHPPLSLRIRSPPPETLLLCPTCCQPL